MPQAQATSHMPKLQPQRLKSTMRSKKRNLPQDFEGRTNYAACVKKKGQSTCVTAIDDSADTSKLSIFFWHYVETF